MSDRTPLDELRTHTIAEGWNLAEIWDYYDELSIERDALKLEVARLNQCDTNMKFLLDCLERAELRLPDYTLGTWQDRAKGLAPSIAALRTRLSAIEKAAGEVKAKQRAFYDHPSLAGLTLMRMEDEINTAIDALAALLEKKGDRDES